MAETYLRLPRGLGDLPLPAEILSNPAVWCNETRSTWPAMVVPCYDGKRLARVQIVYLDLKTGEKAALVSPKLTFGAGQSHIPASFAARVDSDWVALVEGPEDAAVIHAVMGWRCDASLGAGSLGKPHYAPGTSLLIFGDNDGSGPAQAEAAAEAHRARGCHVIVVFAPKGSKDVNDLLRAGGPEAVRTRIELALLYPPSPRVSSKVGPQLRGSSGGLPAFYPAITEPRAEALQRLDDIISTTIRGGAQLADARRLVVRLRAKELAERPDATPAQKGAVTRRLIREVADRCSYRNHRLPRPKRLLVTGSQAIGKTTLALKAVAAIGEQLTVRKYAPTLAKAGEDLEQYRKLATESSMAAMVVRGRSAIDPTQKDKPMCPRHEVANRAAEVGLAPRKAICPGCKLQNECGTLKQEAAIAALGPALYLMAGNYLHLPCPAPDADIVIGDERMTLEAVSEFKIPLNLLASDLVPFHGGDPGPAAAARNTMDRVRRALGSGLNQSTK